MAKAAKYIAVLGIALAVAAALAGAVVAQRLGLRAYEASAIAALVNWVAGTFALVVIIATRNHKQHRINGALLAMASRMVLPLAAVIYATQSHHPLTAFGVVGFIVAFYLIGLAIETAMTVRLVSTGAAAASDSKPVPPSTHVY